MEDSQIIDMYWQRDESAITETDLKYGSFCHSVALNILSINEDTEECINDTYHRAWNSMPPQRPVNLKAWLGKVVRNIAINLWNKNHAQKRYSGMELLLSELEDCIPAVGTVESEIEDAELGRIISAWLRTLSREDRTLFVRRYWNGEALNDLSKEWNIASGRLAQKMYRLRLSLKSSLNKDGVYL